MSADVFPRILLVTDAWAPQINGVVRSLENLKKQLETWGCEVDVIHPGLFYRLPCPGYSEISLAMTLGGRVSRRLKQFDYSAIHISTEGPLGLAARRFCLKHGIPFTTAYHTRFPEYIHARTGFPIKWSTAVMRWFHGPSQAVMVPTPHMVAELQARSFQNLKLWSRGVDLKAFSPSDYTWDDFCQEHELPHRRRPSLIMLYVGRLSVEKNLEAFLSLSNPGLKVVVGDGPQRSILERDFPEAVFLGAKPGSELKKYYSLADVFVFPSRTDTFGLVLLEALACGTPVAAYPVTGPIDVLGGSSSGVLKEDLSEAVREAQAISSQVCRDWAKTFSWEASAKSFLDNLQPIIRGTSLEPQLTSPLDVGLRGKLLPS